MSFFKRLLKSVKSPSSPPAAGIKSEWFEDFPTGSFTGGTFTKILAPGWKLTGRMTVWDVAEFTIAKQAVQPDKTIFAILQDIHQACYTSGHAMTDTPLDEFDATDPRLHPGSIEDGECWGLTHPSEFPIRLEQYKRLLKAAAPSEWAGKISWKFPDLPNILTAKGLASSLDGAQTADRDPLGWDDMTVVCDVPVDDPCDALAILPNGYFTSDMQPAETYAFVQSLWQTFQMRPMGIGSSYMGFHRAQPFNREEAKTFARHVGALYHDIDAQGLETIEALAFEEQTFFIAYVAG